MEWNTILMVVLVFNLILEHNAQFVPVDSCLALKQIISTNKCGSSDKSVSHCVQDDNDQDGLVCVDWKWVPKGKCPYYNRLSMLLDDRDCQPSVGTCAEKTYNSTQSQNYSGCYQKKAQVPSTTISGVENTIEESEKSTTISGIENTTEESEKNLKTALIIVSVILLISIIAIGCCWFKRNDKDRSNRNGVLRYFLSCFRRSREGNDPESNSGETGTLLGEEKWNKEDELKSMTKVQKSALLGCRVLMVKNVDPLKIREHLIQQAVFPDLVLEDIMNKPNRLEQIRQLLDDLPRRDFTAYGKFLECLQRGGYGYIANEIKQKENNLTKKETSEAEDIEEHQHKPKPTQNGIHK